MSVIPALQARAVRKTFGSTNAVHDVDLTVEAGSFWGLVGPNGAGKTTLLSMMVGLLRPDAGESLVLGHPVWDSTAGREAKAVLGVLPDGLALPQRLTGRELLTYLGLLRGLAPDIVAGRTDELLDVLELSDARSTLIAEYSTGMRKKIGLAAAVLHGPEVLVLDEPLEAIDPLSAMTITAILNGFVASGGTVLLSTHDVTDRAGMRSRRSHGTRHSASRRHGQDGLRRPQPVRGVHRSDRRSTHHDGTVMVRILIALRGSIAQHQWRRSGRGVLVLAVLVGLVSAGGTLSLGFVRHARTGADGNVLAVVFVLWSGGQLAQSALTGGDATLRPEIFALLPLPPRRLAWSLLIVALADPVLVLLLIAYAALIPLGATSGIASALAAMVAVVLLTALTSVLSTLVGGVLGPGSRRGRDLGTITIALALSALALAGTLLPAAIKALDEGRARWLTALAHALPSGWGVNAVDAARRGHLPTAFGWVAALAGLTLLAALLWPRVLRRRMGTPSHGHRTRSTPHTHRLLPANPTGAVCAKEMTLWARDPVRLTCLLIAAIVGLGVAVIPRVTAGTGVLMPFGGALTVVIAGACACNLYGNDGTSLWLTVMTPDSARPDVHGRQAAWLIIVAPFAVVETVVLTATSAQYDLWPWATAIPIALLGGAAGLIPIAGLLGVQPLDDAGNPTPGWSIKVHLALYTTTTTALPAAAVLVVGGLAGSTWLQWGAVPIAFVTATSLAWWGQRQATRRLPAVQTDVLNLLAAAA